MIYRRLFPVRGLKTFKNVGYDFLKHEFMYKNCLFDEAIDLSTICWRMKCFVFSAKFILLCGNSVEKLVMLKKYLEDSHGKVPCVKEIFKK